MKSNLKSWIPFQRKHFGYKSDDKPKQDVRGKPCPPGYNKERDGCIPTDGNGESTNETESNELERARDVGRRPAGQDDIGRPDTGRDEGDGRELGGLNSPSVGGTPKTGKIRPQEERIITARAAFTHPADTSIIPEDLRGYLKDHQQQAVAKAKLAMDKYGGFILADGCVAAGTRIYNPITNEHTPIEELVKRGKSHVVLSLTKNGLEPCIAFSPFHKGRAKLYRVTFDDGRNITVTDQHRFLSPSDWTMISDGDLCEGRILACVGGLPENGLGFVPSIHDEDAQRLFGKAEDCLDDYLQDFHPCDAQLHPEADIDQISFPSQVDVPSHFHVLSHTDDLEHESKHNQPYQQIVPPSKMDFLPLGNRSLFLSEYQRLLKPFQPQGDWHLHDPQFVESLASDLSISVESLYQDEFACSQRSCVSESFAFSDIAEYGNKSIGTCLQDHQSSTLLDTDEKYRPINVSEREGYAYSYYCPNREVNQSNYYSRWNRVVSIEFVKEDDFYDMYVPGSENYVAEGIVNHNTGAGKAQPISEPVLTPNGWVPMGNLKKGDQIIAGDGTVTEVTGVFPQGIQNVYKVTMSDGTHTKCTKEHLWLTKTWKERNASKYKREYPNGNVRELSEIMSSILVTGGSQGQTNHSIPMVSAIKFNSRDVKLHPYVMGTLLGDGSLSGESSVFITSIDDELLTTVKSLLPVGYGFGRSNTSDDNITWRISKCGKGAGGPGRPNEVLDAMRFYGLHGKGKLAHTKFIPDDYKFNSIEVRLGILQGLLDTDGHIGKRGTNVEFYSASKQLAKDVQFLVESLGGTGGIRSRIPTYVYKGEKKNGRRSYTVTINLPPCFSAFRLSRKLDRVKPRIKYTPTRYIKRIKLIGQEKCQCISVAHSSSLYVTRHCIVTHNTRAQLAVARMYADQGKKVVIISKSEVIKPSWDKNQFGGSFLEDGQTMGIDMQLTRGLEPLENGNIYLSTFGNLEALSEIVDKDTIVLYDESHSIKNYGTARGIAGNLISDKAGAVMYASATPLDKPLQVAYLFRARLFGDRPWDETRQALGFIKKTHKYGGKKVTTWDINPSVGTAECMRRLSGLFDKMTEEGLMLKREISYEGVDINFSTVKMPPQVHDTMDRIAEAVASLDLPGMVKKGLTLQHQRRQQEAFKVPVTADNAIKELNEGRSVVIFCTRRNKSEVLDYEGNVAAYSDSTIKLMREELERRGIDPSLITELHGGQSKKANRKSMADFQSNKAKIIIATIDSGGTGINLDDRGGKNPRTLLMMTPPYSGMDNVQAAGRVWRMSTKSAPRIKYILGNTDVDYWNASIVGKKMQILGATVSGEIGRLDPTVQVEGEDAMDEIMQKESETPYKWPISLTNAIPDNYNPTTQLGAPDKIYHKLNAKNSTTVGGFTKEHEQVILEQGGQWDPKNNVWYVPHHKAEALRNLPGVVLTGRKKKKVKIPKVKISPIKTPKHLKGMHISKVEMPGGKTQRTHTFLPGENSDFWKLWNSPDRPKYLSIGMNQDGKWEASVWGDSRDDVISGIADLMKRNIYTPPSKGGKPAAASSNEKPDKPTNKKPGSENRPKVGRAGYSGTGKEGSVKYRLYHALSDKPMTMRELMDATGIGKNQIRSSYLNQLVEEGIVVREGRGYRLKRKNEKSLWRPFSKHLLFSKKKIGNVWMKKDMGTSKMKHDIAKALLVGLKHENDDESDERFMDRASKIEKEDMLFDSDEDAGNKMMSRSKTLTTNNKDKKWESLFNVMNDMDDPKSIRIYYQKGPPSIFYINVMDWADREDEMSITSAASHIVGDEKRVMVVDEGAKPEGNWDEITLDDKHKYLSGNTNMSKHKSLVGLSMLEVKPSPFKYRTKGLPGYGKKDGVAPPKPPTGMPKTPDGRGFTGKIEDSIGRNRCYQDGEQVPCNPNGSDEQDISQSQDGQEQEGGDSEYTEEGREHAQAPQGEKIVKAPCCLYTPDPTVPNPETGIPESRIGVPAMQVPPPPKEIPRLPNLTERERKAETDFANAFLNDPDGVVAEYMKQKNTVVGKDDNGNPKYAIGDAPNIFNTDDAKVLSPDYNPPGSSPDENKNARGVFNLAVHQTANAVAKRAFVSYLDSDEFKKLPDDKKFVLVTAGGVAAGKGYALGKSSETSALQQMAGAVWDAAGEQNAAENPWILAECRKRGIKAKFAFIHANPIETWENPKRGVVQRANNQGRMVDARVFADSYAQGAKNFKRFMDENIEAEDINFYIVNNATGGEPQMASSFPEESLSIDGEALYERASKVLQERASQLRPSVVRGGSLGQRVWGKSKASAKSLIYKNTKVLQGHIRMKAISDENDEIAKALLQNIAYNNANYEKTDADEFERSMKVKPYSGKTTESKPEEQPEEGKNKARMPNLGVKKTPFNG